MSMISGVYVESKLIKYKSESRTSSMLYCSEKFSQNKTKSNSSISPILLFTGKLPAGLTLNLRS